MSDIEQNREMVYKGMSGRNALLTNMDGCADVSMTELLSITQNYKLFLLLWLLSSLSPNPSPP